MSAVLVVVLVFFGLAGGLGAVAYFTYQRKLRRAKAIERGLKMIPILIHLPPPSSDTHGDNRDIREVMREKTAQAEVLYNLLSGTSTDGFKSTFYGQRHVALELIVVDGIVHFFAVAPVALVSVVKKAVITAYPGARLEEIEDHNIFNQEGRLAATLGGEMVLRTESAYPIATYEQLERDPMEALLTTVSALEKQDGVAIQIMLRPANSKWVKRSEAVAESLRKGEHSSLKFSAMDLAKAVVKAPSAQREEDRAKYGSAEVSQLALSQVERIEEKTKHPGFEVLVRVIVSTGSVARSQQLLREIATAFALYEAPGLNGFKFLPAVDVQGLVTAFIFRFFPPELKSNVLSSAELATMFHLPDSQFTPSASVERQQSKQVDGPVSMPTVGLLFGYNEFRGVKKEIRLSNEDRRRHTYILGQTGTGKSTMLENLAVQDMLSGNGFAFIDPHGDSAEKLLALVPKERAEDVIYFNPADTQYPLGLNLFEFKDPSQKDFLVQETINMLYKLYDPGHTGIIGPRYEHWYRNAALTLMSDPSGATFIEIPKVFTDTDYLKQKFKFLKDPTVIDFWTKEMGQTSDYHKSEMLGWFVSKFGAFQNNEMMRNIIGQTKSAFDIRDVMDKKKILIVNLSKGRIGELNSQLLGMIFVIKFQAAAMSRADVPEDQRPDFALYVDEFQNFSTDSFASILSEARKYRLNLIVANQFIGQLSNEIRDAVFGNIGTIVAHRMGPDDAEFMVKQFAPIFDASDLVNIPNYNAAMRLMIGGLPSQPFSIHDSAPLGSANVELGIAIKQLSAAKYGHDKAVVEADILDRFSGHPVPSASAPQLPTAPGGAPASTGGAPVGATSPGEAAKPAGAASPVSNSAPSVDAPASAPANPVVPAAFPAPAVPAPAAGVPMSSAAAGLPVAPAVGAVPLPATTGAVVGATNAPSSAVMATTPPPIGAPPVGASVGSVAVATAVDAPASSSPAPTSTATVPVPTAVVNGEVPTAGAVPGVAMTPPAIGAPPIDVPPIGAPPVNVPALNQAAPNVAATAPAPVDAASELARQMASASASAPQATTALGQAASASPATGGLVQPPPIGAPPMDLPGAEPTVNPLASPAPSAANTLSFSDITGSKEPAQNASAATSALDEVPILGDSTPPQVQEAAAQAVGDGQPLEGDPYANIDIMGASAPVSGGVSVQNAPGPISAAPPSIPVSDGTPLPDDPYGGIDILGEMQAPAAPAPAASAPVAGLAGANASSANAPAVPPTPVVTQPSSDELWPEPTLGQAEPARPMPGSLPEPTLEPVSASTSEPASAPLPELVSAEPVEAAYGPGPAAMNDQPPVSKVLPAEPAEMAPGPPPMAAEQPVQSDLAQGGQEAVSPSGPQFVKGSIPPPSAVMPAPGPVSSVAVAPAPALGPVAPAPAPQASMPTPVPPQAMPAPQAAPTVAPQVQPAVIPQQTQSPAPDWDDSALAAAEQASRDSAPPAPPQKPEGLLPDEPLIHFVDPAAESILNSPDEPAAANTDGTPSMSGLPEGVQLIKPGSSSTTSAAAVPAAVPVSSPVGGSVAAGSNVVPPDQEGLAKGLSSGDGLVAVADSLPDDLKKKVVTAKEEGPVAAELEEAREHIAAIAAKPIPLPSLPEASVVSVPESVAGATPAVKSEPAVGDKASETMAAQSEPKAAEAKKVEESEAVPAPSAVGSEKSEEKVSASPAAPSEPSELPAIHDAKSESAPVAESAPEPAKTAESSASVVSKEPVPDAAAQIENAEHQIDDLLSVSLIHADASSAHHRLPEPVEPRTDESGVDLELNGANRPAAPGAVGADGKEERPAVHHGLKVIQPLEPIVPPKERFAKELAEMNRQSGALAGTVPAAAVAQAPAPQAPVPPPPAVQAPPPAPAAPAPASAPAAAAKAQPIAPKPTVAATVAAAPALPVVPPASKPAEVLVAPKPTPAPAGAPKVGPASFEDSGLPEPVSLAANDVAKARVEKKPEPVPALPPQPQPAAIVKHDEPMLPDAPKEDMDPEAQPGDKGETAESQNAKRRRRRGGRGPEKPAEHVESEAEAEHNKPSEAAAGAAPLTGKLILPTGERPVAAPESRKVEKPKKLAPGEVYVDDSGNVMIGE